MFNKNSVKNSGSEASKATEAVGAVLSGVKDGFAEIKLNKAQAVFSAICFAAAVCAAVALLLGANSVKEVKGFMANPFGGDTVVLDIAEQNSGIDTEDIKNFAAENPDMFKSVSPYRTIEDVEIYGNTGLSVDGSVIVTDDLFFSYAAVQIVSGKGFSDTASDAAVVTEDMTEQLFGDSDPVGQTVKVNNRVYEVVGICRSVNGCELSESVILPYGGARLILNSNEVGSYTFICGGDKEEAQKLISTFVSKNMNKRVNSDYTVALGFDGGTSNNRLIYTLFIILLILSGLCLMMFALFPARRRRTGADRLNLKGFYAFGKKEFICASAAFAGSVIGALLGVLASCLYCRIIGYTYLFSALPPLKILVFAVVFSILIGIVPSLIERANIKLKA